MTCRTRFAPSPTGFLHIGGARTALYCYLEARRSGGAFVLRIEDTDRERSTQAAVDAILQAMDWLGLEYDEGPIYQTDRLQRYQDVAERMVATLGQIPVVHNRASTMITVSVGVAQYDGRCSPEEFIEQADHAMYRAKQEG